MAIELNTENFKQEVLDFDGVVLVDFWAAWCGPCKMIAPTIAEIADEYKDNNKVKVAKLNVDENSEIAQEYGIMSIPALKFFKDGAIVDEIVGVQPKELIVEKLQDLQ